MKQSIWRELAKPFLLGFAVLIFFITVLLAGVWIGNSEGYYNGMASGFAARIKDDTNNRVASCLPQRDQSLRANCVAKALENSRDEQRAESDLSAQRQMADWAWWLLIATIIQAPLTAVGIVLL